MGEGAAVGTIPRFSKDLFERINSLSDGEVSTLLLGWFCCCCCFIGLTWRWLQTIFKVTVSFYEIYNEKIHDLLSARKKKMSVSVGSSCCNSLISTSMLCSIFSVSYVFVNIPFLVPTLKD